MLAEKASAANPGLLRVAHKMATGSGKTVVMAVLIAWQTLNRVALAVFSINCRRSLDALGTLAKKAKARDEEARPFPKPDTGHIAIKVINHYGDEVMKIYEQ